MPGRVVIECADLDATLEWFRRELGMRIDRISPADDPSEYDLSGHDISLRLRRVGHVADSSVTLEIDADATLTPGTLIAPNGTTVEVRRPVDDVVVPAGEPSLVISRESENESFGIGRAGMGYRDLIPGRWGGRFIASHILIAGGGEVPDYAHFHRIRFQLIFVRRGWVKVVYEDQGEPFVMQAGDCVLQPPEIRHRVLESSAGLEVVEIGCPAEHDTFADHDIELPTGELRPERDFGGQRFVRHIAADASYAPWHRRGFECRDTGIGDATGGLGGVRVVRPTGEIDAASMIHDAEFVFWFALEGSLDARFDGTDVHLNSGDSVAIPAGLAHAVTATSPDLVLLEVTLPDQIQITTAAADV